MDKINFIKILKSCHLLEVDFFNLLESYLNIKKCRFNMKNLKTLKIFNLNIQMTLFIYLLLITCISSLAIASDAIKDDNFSGIFIGISGGEIYGSAKSLRYRQGGAFGNISTENSITDNGWIVGGQAQISQTFNNIYNIGLEVWANRSFADLQTKDNIFFQETLSYKIKQSIGIAGKFGIVNGSALFYIKPGILFAKRDIFSQYLSIFMNNGAPIPPHTNKKYMHGFSFGIGADIAIPNTQFTVGGEVTATQYQSFNYIHPMPEGITGDINTQFKPKTFTFLLKANYKLYSFS